jgi:small-conductance mechanosensitive channel
MIDFAFGGLVSLVVLTILDFNPWPLLVSMSTLFVSFSFAMGSSASKYIEGVLLISLRRPYDLGDRIVIAPDVGPTSAWFVEDINLYTTTLRLAASNEVATVPNGTIAGNRICNLNRSPNAVCVLQVTLHECIVGNDLLEAYKSQLEKYVEEHPRIWESVVNFRVDRYVKQSTSQKHFQLLSHKY